MSYKDAVVSFKLFSPTCVLTWLTALLLLGSVRWLFFHNQIDFLVVKKSKQSIAILGLFGLR